MAHLQKKDTPSPPRTTYAGLVVSLAKEAFDATAYQDAEIVWRLQKEHHVGLYRRVARPGARPTSDRHLCRTHCPGLYSHRAEVRGTALLDKQKRAPIYATHNSLSCQLF